MLTANTNGPKTILKHTQSRPASSLDGTGLTVDINVLQYSEGIRGAKSMPVGLKPNFCPSTASPPTMLFIPYWTDLLSHRQDNSHRFTSTYILKPTHSRMGRFPSTILLVIVLVFGVRYGIRTRILKLFHRYRTFQCCVSTVDLRGPLSCPLVRRNAHKLGGD